MSDRPKSDRPAMSDRAAAIEAETEQLKAERRRAKEEADKALKSRADDVAISLLQGLDPSLDEDSKVQQVLNLMSPEKLAALQKQYDERIKATPPEFATKPPITKPTPEALRDSRHEPTVPPEHGTVRSPPPKMTPPRGGIPVPSTAHDSTSSGIPRPIEPRPFPGPSPVPSSAPRIIVCDDDPDILSALSEALAEEGYSVCKADDGWKAALCLAEMGRVDLILLDWMMPGKAVDGAAFMEWLNKTANPWHDTPVLIITALHPSMIDYDIADAFVFVKPIRLEMLLRSVRTHIGERRRR